MFMNFCKNINKKGTVACMKVCKNNDDHEFAKSLFARISRHNIKDQV